MKKYRLIVVLLALCAAAGFWADWASRRVLADGGSPSVRAEDAVRAVPPQEAAKTMSLKAVVEPVPRPAKVYKLAGEIKQEELLKALLAAVSGNVPAAELKADDWDMDWGEDLGTQSTKTFYRSGPQKDRVLLDAFLLGTAGNFTEVVLRGSLRVCTDPSQGDLLETLRKEGFEVNSPTAPVHGFGSGYWRSVYEFRRGGLSGLTYHVVPTGVTGCLELSLRDGKIAGALPLKDFNFYSLFPTGLQPKLVSDLENAGVEKLVPDWTKVKEVSASTGPLYSGGLEVLAKAYAAVPAPAGGEQAAAFGVLKAQLIVQLFSRSVYEDTPPEKVSGKPFRRIMDENGIKYFESHYDGVFPARQFSPEIYEGSPGSYWGQYAFLQDMYGGYGGDDCHYGLLTDRPIKIGEEFLSKHPDSPFYTDVQFLLGRAYETLYNQGFSIEYCDQYGDKNCAELVAAQEQNRLKTLEAYEAVLASPAGAKYKPFIDGIVPRLKVRGKTYCYQYFPRCD